MDNRFFFNSIYMTLLFIVFLFSASFIFANENGDDDTSGGVSPDDRENDSGDESDIDESESDQIEDERDRVAEQFVETTEEYEQELEDLQEAREERERRQENGQDTGQIEEEIQQSEKKADELKEEIETAFSNTGTSDIQEAYMILPDEKLEDSAEGSSELEGKSATEIKLEMKKELEGRKDCGDNFWSFACNLIRDDEAKDLQIRRTREQITQNTAEAGDLEQYNKQLMDTVNTEIGGYLSEGDFDEGKCEAPTRECKEQIESISCDDNDASCERRKESALETFEVARNEYRVEGNDFLEVASYLDVDESSYEFANIIQDVAGFEVSLIQEGTAVDDILSAGTPEQVCLAKVDSFMSAEGVDVDGKTYDAPEQNTDFKTRQKACDNSEFEICADLRAEKSGLFFENKFDIIVHFYVYNPKDYEQEFIINAELTNDNSEQVNFNVFENSSQVEGKSITLASGEKSSMSIILSEMSPFDSNEYSEVYGNVILSVHEKTGDGSNFGSSNLEYALDYPLMTIEGSSSTPEQLRKDIENSGAEATDGVSDSQTFSNSLIDRVQIN